MDFPKAVLLERQRLVCTGDTHKVNLLDSLMRDEAAVLMWKTLERRSSALANAESDDGLWVAAFLAAVTAASSPPRYQTASTADRKDLANRLRSLRNEMEKLLDVYELDFHIVQLNGKTFNGLYVFEDFGDANRARIRGAGDQLMPASELMANMIGRCIDQVEQVKPAKQGSNALAIRFIRDLAERNKRAYEGEVLNAVIATAANAIYGTDYVESDVRNLLNRISKGEGLQSRA